MHSSQEFDGKRALAASGLGGWQCTPDAGPPGPSQSMLRRLGYEPTRQRGSHVRVSTRRDGVNHEVVPLHTPLKARTLGRILGRVARHHGLSRLELLALLFGGR